MEHAPKHAQSTTSTEGAAKSFRDWSTRCEGVTEDGKKVCYIFQNLLLKSENKRLLHVAVGYLSDGEQPAAFFTLPAPGPRGITGELWNLYVDDTLRISAGNQQDDGRTDLYILVRDDRVRG